MLGIYKIEAPSGNFYIGSSANVKKRFYQHKRELRSGTHVNSALRYAAAKYGVDALKFYLYVCVLDRKHLIEVEQMLLDELQPAYNISKNAECALFDESVKTKRIEALSKPVVRLSDGTVFPSGYAVARHYNITRPDNISTAIRHGWKFADEFWAFVGDDVTYEQLAIQYEKREKQRKQNAAKAATKARSKAVVCLNTGETFQSCTHAETAKNVARGRVSHACIHKGQIDGLFWKFADEPDTLEEREMAYSIRLSIKKDKQSKAVQERFFKQVRCKETGEVFRSIKEALSVKALSKDSVLISIKQRRPVCGFSWEYVNA